MILSNTFLVVFFLAVLAAVFALLRVKCKDLFSRGGAVIISFLVAFFAFYLVQLTATKMIFVENDPNSEGQYTHRLVRFYGNTSFDIDDYTIHTGDMNLKIGKYYLYNCTNTRMLMYPAVYGEGKKLEKFVYPNPIIIEVDSCKLIPDSPDFWFTDTPPERVYSGGHFIQSIVENFTGHAELKWGIVPLAVNENLEDAPKDED